jgi:flavin-dependent dehydrogenase
MKRKFILVVKACFSSMERLDLIIVGAGPAGSVAAYTAAKLGLTTLLIEKEMMPRYKPCGGGLTPKAIDFLEARDLLDKNVVERKCREMKIFCAEYRVYNNL